MGDPGAYWDEMGNHRLNDRDIERLLSGRAPEDPSCRELTEALLGLRAAGTMANHSDRKQKMSGTPTLPSWHQSASQKPPPTVWSVTYCVPVIAPKSLSSPQKAVSTTAGTPKKSSNTGPAASAPGT